MYKDWLTFPIIISRNSFLFGPGYFYHDTYNSFLKLHKIFGALLILKIIQKPTGSDGESFIPFNQAWIIAFLPNIDFE